MNAFPLNFSKKDGLIVTTTYINDSPFTLALDTGASHTTVDLTLLLLIGFEMKDVIRVEQLETASGSNRYIHFQSFRNAMFWNSKKGNRDLCL
jgi:predicted aspartyl protease